MERRKGAQKDRSSKIITSGVRKKKEHPCVAQPFLWPFLYETRQGSFSFSWERDLSAVNSNRSHCLLCCQVNSMTLLLCTVYPIPVNYNLITMCSILRPRYLLRQMSLYPGEGLVLWSWSFMLCVLDVFPPLIVLTVFVSVADCACVFSVYSVHGSLSLKQH